MSNKEVSNKCDYEYGKAFENRSVLSILRIY